MFDLWASRVIIIASMLPSCCCVTVDKEATVRDALDRMVADTVMRGGLPEPEMQSLNTLTTLAPATEAMSGMTAMVLWC